MTERDRERGEKRRNERALKDSSTEVEDDEDFIEEARRSFRSEVKQCMYSSISDLIKWNAYID